uniref:acyl-CoA dehydrogenase family protein n=1 Tax=uncultured Sphingomonas sp. TaxID=158754 RepID=UPI0035CAF9F1
MALDPETFDALIDTVRRFVAERLRPLEAAVEEADAIPADVVQEMRELGLFGLSIAEEHGGLGLTMFEEAKVAIELGRTTPAFRSTFGTNVGIGSQGLVMAGNAEQKAAWLPRIASGEIITSFALTEPDVGSDSGAVKTRAVFDGQSYRLSGTKRYITNADKADLFTVMARTGDDPGARGVSAFLVPRDLAGVSIGEPEKKMGQKGAKVADVIFDDVVVPAENRLGAEGEGFKIAMRVLDRGRLHISAVCVGVAERLIADCVAYATERKQFGKAISEHQLIQGMLADSKTEALVARAMVLETAAAKDAGKDVVMESAAAKYFASEMVGRVADRAVQIFGGAGYIADYGIERLYRDVRLFRI